MLKENHNNPEIQAAMENIPLAFLTRMADLLGDEFPAFAAIYGQPSTHGLRVNTLKLSPIQFDAISPFTLEPIPWNPSGYLLAESEDRPGKHPYHAAGLYYLQDPHAQAVAEIFDPQPGERVLDLAAAPGGKTTHIASRMQNQGVLVANDIKTKRINYLASNLERWGVRNAAVINETPERMADFFGAFFDRVLVDAPCSGEGMFRKDPRASADWSEEMVAGCAVRQDAIIHHASRMVQPGGFLCYSTCTFASEENEGVIERFLDGHPDFSIADIRFEQWQPDNLHVSNSHYGLRLWPHRSPGEGHFIALLQRWHDAVGPNHLEFEYPALTRSQQDWLHQWSMENLTAPLVGTPVQIGRRVYAIPQEMPRLDGLRVVHPGWWLGDLKKDRFEPSHALAMALQVGDTQRIHSLSVDGLEALKYLRCETLFTQEDDGWTLVALKPEITTAGHSNLLSANMAFPLGWGKAVRGTLKNHYPRGLKYI